MKQLQWGSKVKMKTDHITNHSESSVIIFYQCTIFMKMKDENLKLGQCSQYND